jgi:hypothetical protein
MIIEIRSSRGTKLAENKDQAQAIRVEKILPSLENGEPVVLDFGAVNLATQSYVHALISEAIRTYGDNAFTLLSFRHCNEAIQQVVLTVFEYTLAAAEAAQPRLPLAVGPGEVY